MHENDTNVGIGMVSHRSGCRCDECEVERLQRQVGPLRAEIERLKHIERAAKAALDTGFIRGSEAHLQLESALLEDSPRSIDNEKNAFLAGWMRAVHWAFVENGKAIESEKAAESSYRAWK